MKTKQRRRATLIEDGIEIARISCRGFGEPIVIHLTPLGKRNWEARAREIKREEELTRRLMRRDARIAAAELREMDRQNRREDRQLKSLLKALHAKQAPRGRTHTCAACSSKTKTWIYRSRPFCPDCIKLGRGDQIEVKCPKHNEWCGGRYGTCAGCWGESVSGELL